MKELLAKIKASMIRFTDEAGKAADGNKSAGARSRKESTELTKLFKEWRKISVVRK